MENTKIAWCDHTFNPWVGCEAVSDGCANCFARQIAEHWNGRGAFKIRRKTGAAYWRRPGAWSFKASLTGDTVRVFCGSMCDWLDDKVPVELLGELMTRIANTPNLTWLMLTKRPENWSWRMRTLLNVGMPGESARRLAEDWLSGVAPDNVWFGVTAENQAMLEDRVAWMAEIPAEVRWVSAEPLLGLVSVLTRIGDVDWVVAGGEQGKGARECRAEWIVDLFAQCREIGVPFFFKQWGTKTDLELSKNGLCEWSVAEKTQQWPE